MIKDKFKLDEIYISKREKHQFELDNIKDKIIKRLIDKNSHIITIDIKIEGINKIYKYYKRLYKKKMVDEIRNDVLEEKLNRFKKYMKDSKYKMSIYKYNNKCIIFYGKKYSKIELREMIGKALYSTKLNEYDVIVKDLSYEKQIEFINYRYIRSYNKVYIKYSNEEINIFLREMSNLILGSGKKYSQEQLIIKINSKMKSWFENKKNLLTKKVKNKINSRLFILTYKWAKRKHQQKSKKWIIEKYWKSNQITKYLFATKNLKLLKIEEVIK